MTIKRLSGLDAMAGADWATGDLFLVEDLSTGALLKMTRAELLLALAAGGAPLVIKQTGTAVSHTGDTDETILGWVNVGGGLLGANGALELDKVWEATGSAGTWTMIVRIVAGTANGTLAGTTLLSKSMTANTKHRFNALIFNAGAVDSQALHVGVSAAGGASGYIHTTTALGTAAIDTASAFTVSLNAQLAAGADAIALRHLRATLHAAG